MSVFLKSLGREIYFAIEKKYIEPKDFDEIDSRAYEANSKATYALMQSLNDDDLSRVIYCESAYDIWRTLITTHEGTSQVKRAKIDLLMSEYENFTMHDNEGIDDMLTRFNNITNGLISLGEKITNDQKVRKIIRSLPRSWEVKATTLKELNDAKEMDFIAFMGNLKTHEMEVKARESRDPQKKKGIAFNVDHEDSHGDEEQLEGEDDLSFIVRNVTRLLYKKGGFNGRRWQAKKREQVGPCYKCNKLGHMMADCPLAKDKNTPPRKPFKKKALQATWDDSEAESEEERPDTANMCFMAGEEVNPNEELTFDTLAYAFEDLRNSFNTLKSKHSKLKREHDILLIENNNVTHEKNDLTLALDKIRKEFGSHMSSCKNTKIPIDRVEIENMKDRMNKLDSTLSKCAFDKTKLEAMFKKKSTPISQHPRVSPTHHAPHASHSHHTTHTHHSHPHHYAFMYAKVYTCSFCGRKGHIDKFCYDKLHVANIWVKPANKHGPKKIWVPKTNHPFDDVGTSQGGKT